MKLLQSLFLILFSIFTTTLIAQVKEYSAQWKKVDDLVIKNRLPQSALAEVNKIYALAKKENQPAQVIKSLVYMVELQRSSRENNDVLSIMELEKETAVLKEPAASILKSILATHYWKYFNENRYYLYDRTNTENFKKEDIATWTADDLHKKISALYLESVANEDLLKQTRLESFNAIIVKGNQRHLRPTLFDLLAHEALEYFQNNERDITKPAFAFEINQEEAFAPAAEFVKQSFHTSDSLSLHHKALMLYQQLIAFHLNDTDPNALIDVDISRIEFVYQNSTATNKELLYTNALESIINQYQGNAYTQQASFLLADWHTNLSRNYDPLKDSAHRFSMAKAIKILEPVVKDSSIKTAGWYHSFNLLHNIQKPSFSFELEKVNLPSLPFRALVTYKNEKALHFKIVRAEDFEKQKSRAGKAADLFWTPLIKANSVRTWTQPLPETGDYQQHRVEIKINELPIGEYYLVASSDEKFNEESTRIGARLFYVSNISYTNFQEDLFVLHRETGLPLVKADITVYKNIYDYKTSRYTRSDVGSYTTDINGYAKLNLPKKNRYDQFYFDITHLKDSLDLDESHYAYQYIDYREDEPAKISRRTFFFTDRSIYRPGQTIFFKGIVVNRTNADNAVASNHGTTVYLVDANYEVRDSLNLITNEYGSYSGSFRLPQNLLNGNFRIRTKENDGATYFSVEEYKRPKFMVELLPVKESFRVNDSITVTGTAKAYAGNNIDGAKVSYRVIRKPRFIYRWYYRGWLPPYEEMEIAHGETISDAEGKFNISFNAIPDLSIDKKSDPLFDYEISVDVTDINGETRSDEMVVTAGYKSLLLDVSLPTRIPVDSLHSFQLKTENMNGEFQPSQVTVLFHKLQPEQRLIRERYWEQPDQFIMTRQEYIRYFPHDEYSNETDSKTWPRISTISRSDSSRRSGEWIVNNKELSPGFYQVEIITKDKDGNEVKDIHDIELYDASQGFNRPEYLWIGKTALPIEPGERTEIEIGSSAMDIFLVNHIDKKEQKGFTEVPIGQPGGKQPIPNLEQKEKASEFRFARLDRDKKTFAFDASESDRGGYGTAFFFVKDNRFYLFSDVISVPWINKDLKIEYASFRDKTLPGSEEKWKVKISGVKGELVAAEMLASMYDASLDQFRMHQWSRPNIWGNYYRNLAWDVYKNFSSIESSDKWIETKSRIAEFNYDELMSSIYMSERFSRILLQSKREGIRSKSNELRMSAPVFREDMEVAVIADSIVAFDSDGDGMDDTMDSPVKKTEEVQVRTNFNETAFFFPDLQTSADGSIEFSFTAPEALTKWKLQTLAHTKDLAFGYASKELVTQKQLMVQPNMPRFVRQGDRMEFNTKIVNLSEEELTGQVQLMLFDASTNESVDGYFINTFPNQYFTVAPGQSQLIKFPIQIPFQFNNALTWRIIARAGNFSDGEENTLPVLTNKVLVTETLPMPVKGNQVKQFSFEKLLQSGNSETLQHHALTVEYTSNPIWYAVQALPYLMEYPYDCAEQTWNRYYANALASHISNSMPRIKQVFEKWKTIDTPALVSNLAKNQELKSALLEETPWVLKAKSETEQKQNIALLFDMVRMANEMESNLQKLRDMQSSNGGFVWFKGGPDDRYITQYIITGIGHLKKLGVNVENLSSILDTAIPYLDRKISEDYENLLKHKAKLADQQVGATQIQYLYMRSFFPQYDIPEASKTAYNYYRKQLQQFWTKQSIYLQGMTALSLHRTGDKTTPVAILKSLKERSVFHDELGRYWKDNQFGLSWRWTQAPIETQSLLIEAFNEIQKNTETVDEMRTWLLKNKQTNNWRTTKATADACYAMLLQGTNWLNNDPVVEIRLGNTNINNTNHSEAGTGYFKQTVAKESIQPSMGNITVSVKPSNNNNTVSNGTSWGAVYWQYFEDMDKVTTAETPLKLQKKLFIEKNSDLGPVLTPVEENTNLQVGDKISVRIELRVDRDMEYVHMKDMRASALEPVNVLSGYRWQGGLGYYETTKDASVNFFFSRLPKGTYVFEYALFVTHTGNFTNGITSIQCMYAPEFSAHSEGVRISVE